MSLFTRGLDTYYTRAFLKILGKEGCTRVKINVPFDWL